LKIFYLKTVNSTQKYLKNLILESEIKESLAVASDIQTDGIGSRDNTWLGLDGNLFLSFAIKLKDLPDDLKLESASIYFAYILKDTLQDLESKLWLKWPNDFYINNKKIGGMITTVVKDFIVCGVGLNLVNSPQNFTILDIKIQRNELLKRYIKNIEKKFTWKQIFSKYKLNFYLNQKFYTHNKKLRISLEDAKLQEDGSIIINNERIYSLR